MGKFTLQNLRPPFPRIIARAAEPRPAAVFIVPTCRAARRAARKCEKYTVHSRERASRYVHYNFAVYRVRAFAARADLQQRDLRSFALESSLGDSLGATFHACEETKNIFRYRKNAPRGEEIRERFGDPAFCRVRDLPIETGRSSRRTGSLNARPSCATHCIFSHFN